MPKTKRIAILLISLFLFSCGTVGTENIKNYVVDLTYEANVGATMISNKQATYIDGWVGIANSPNG